MALNLKKGLFRTYIIINIITLIFGYILIDESEWVEDLTIRVLVMLLPWLLHYAVSWIIRGFKPDFTIQKSVKALKPEPELKKEIEIDNLKIEKKIKHARRNCTAGWIIGSITIFSFFAPATSINPNWSIGDKIAVLVGLCIFPLISLLTGIFTFLRLKNINTILLIAYSIILAVITCVRSLIAQ